MNKLDRISFICAKLFVTISIVEFIHFMYSLHSKHSVYIQNFSDAIALTEYVNTIYALLFIIIYYFLENAFLKYSVRIFFYLNLLLYSTTWSIHDKETFYIYFMYMLMTVVIFYLIDKKEHLKIHPDKYKSALIIPFFLYTFASIYVSLSLTGPVMRAFYCIC